jgi:single-strand DNA-binding protein
MLNVSIIQGRLVEDPQIRQTKNGVTVAAFSIANDQRYKGEKETHFFDVSVFGKSAEFAQKYLGKGCMTTVKGQLRQEKWTNKDGANRRKVSILGEVLYPIDWKGDKQGNPQPQNQSTPTNNQPDDFDYPGMDDDIPF